jgi:cysteinyl-tRNA synthetase
MLKRYNSNTLRLYFFSQHYRESIIFSKSKLNKFEIIDKTLRNTIDNVLPYVESGNNSKLLSKFIRYIEDDFDTPRALDLLINTVRLHDELNNVKNMVNIFGLQY